MLLAAQPSGRANSFVGTEEYLAPEVITGVGEFVCCCRCDCDLLQRFGMACCLLG
jgi:hypothetical protein